MLNWRVSIKEVGKMAKRIQTDYPGIFYREAKRLGKSGIEKVYYAVFKKNGKIYEEKVGRQFADDMTPARAATIRGELIEGKRQRRAEIREQEQAAKEADASKATIDKLWTDYKGNRKPGKSLKTDEGRYKLYLKDPFGKKEPHEIIPLETDRLRLTLMKTKSPKTVRDILGLLEQIINYGKRRNLCQGLQFLMQKPKVNNLKTEDLTQGQLKKLLDAIDSDTHEQAGPMMKMALYTGMRRGEMFKLKWSDVDFERGFIRLRTPKGGIDQTIPLNDMVRQLLNSHIKISEYVFPGRGGNQRTDINKAVNDIKDKAGLPEDFRPLHGLRHTYASMLASSGEVDMYTLQKLLTHKTPQMTQRYAHLRDEALRKASDLAGSLIQQATKAKTGE